MITKKIIGVIIILAVAMGVLFLVLDGKSTEETITEDEPVAKRLIPVRTTNVTQERLTFTRNFPGNIEEWELAYISGVAGARLQRLYVQEGEYVDKGDTLAVMEQTNLDQSRVRLNTARREVERLQNLVEVGAVSGQQLERAESEYQNARSSYDQIRENTFLTAPISGIVTDNFFVEGEIYAPGGTRPAIISLMTMDPVKVTIHLSERLYPLLHKGMKVEVQLDSYPGQSFEGEISHISRRVSPVSRTFKTEIRIENEHALLNPGMFARVRLNLEDREGLFLPAAAVQRVSGTDNRYVFTVDGDTARRIDISVGQRFEEKLQITEGLQANTPVIMEGIERLLDGTRVRVID